MLVPRRGREEVVLHHLVILGGAVPLIGLWVVIGTYCLEGQRNREVRTPSQGCRSLLGCSFFSFFWCSVSCGAVIVFHICDGNLLFLGDAAFTLVLLCGPVSPSSSFWVVLLSHSSCGVVLLSPSSFWVLLFCPYALCSVPLGRPE